MAIYLDSAEQGEQGSTKPATKPCFGSWPNDAAFGDTVEQRDPVELTVQGFMPHLIAGTLYRTGPGRRTISDTAKGEYQCSHWFDGFTYLHKFEIIPSSNGSCRVLYSSRGHVDELVERIRQTGDFDGFSFGQRRDPCMSFFQKLKSSFRPWYLYADGLDIDNVGVTLSVDPPDWPRTAPPQQDEEKVTKPKHLIIRTDAAVTRGVDPETLEPLGIARQHKLHPSLTGWMSASHAQDDPNTGDVYNFNLAFAVGYTCTYRVFCTSRATGKTKVLATIHQSDVRPAYLHSFFLTDDFVVLCVWSSFFAAGGAKVLWEKNIMDAIIPFNHRGTTKWLVVDRHGDRGLVAKFDSPAMFAFHTVNAFQKVQEDGSIDVFCDLIQYPSLDVLHRFYYDNLLSTGSGVHKYAGNDIDRSGQKPCLARYLLQAVNLSARQVASTKETKLVFDLPSPLVGDLPVINPNVRFREHRYVYTLVDRGLSSFVDGIGKLDILTHSVQYWSRQNHTPGEAIFIPNPESPDEDSGYLLSVVLDGDKGTSYLLCLDARNMQKVGRAEAETAIGMGFHGVHTARL